MGKKGKFGIWGLLLYLLNTTGALGQIDTLKAFLGYQSDCLPIAIERLLAIPSPDMDGRLLALIQPRVTNQIIMKGANQKSKKRTGYRYEAQKYPVGDDVFGDACIGDNGDFWTIANRVPVVFASNRETAYFDSFPPYTVYRSILKGNNGEILILTTCGVYKTADRGVNWEILDGEFTHNLENIKRTDGADTTWLRFADTTPRKIILDKDGVFWAERYPSLIYSDDNLKTWQQYNSLPEVSPEYGHKVVTIVGVTPSGRLILLTNDNVLWIVSRSKAGFKKLCGLKSRYAGEAGARQGMFKMVFMNNTLAYTDACLKYSRRPDIIYERDTITCPNSPKCQESLIRISLDYGRSWQEYALAENVSVDDLKIIDKSLYAYTSIGILQIPLSCFK